MKENQIDINKISESCSIGSGLSDTVQLGAAKFQKVVQLGADCQIRFNWELRNFIGNVKYYTKKL